MNLLSGKFTTGNGLGCDKIKLDKVSVPFVGGGFLFYCDMPPIVPRFFPPGKQFDSPNFHLIDTA